MAAGGCGGVGREDFDCPGNTSFFGSSGFHDDFVDYYNQPYHVWGFIAQTAALPGSNSSLNTNLLIGLAGNFAHDYVQGKLIFPAGGRGTSWQDYVLSEAGMEIGVMISNGTIVTPSELSEILRDRLGSDGPGSRGRLQFLYDKYGPLGENLEP